MRLGHCNFYQTEILGIVLMEYLVDLIFIELIPLMLMSYAKIIYSKLQICFSQSDRAYCWLYLSGLLASSCWCIVVKELLVCFINGTPNIHWWGCMLVYQNIILYGIIYLLLHKKTYCKPRSLKQCRYIILHFHEFRCSLAGPLLRPPRKLQPRYQKSFTLILRRD